MNKKRIITKETREKIRLALIGHKVSKKTREAVRLKNSVLIGENARHWKGGKVNREGYIGVYNPCHPFADKMGYVKEHRLIMEKVVGRHLHRWEIVHHVNEIRNDNRPENLKIMTISQHMSLHNKGKKK